MSIPRKRRSTGKVTIADVAQLAGVGTMTVSRALRTPEQVSDKLREKIEAAVHELGYMPNLAASALASASSHTIAMVVPNLAEAGCSEMFAGLQQILQPAGYQIMLAESQHRVEQEEKLLETLLASNIAAAILLSVEHSTTVRQWLKNASIPVMEMGAIRSDPIDMNIGIDNVAAMYELTEMLIQRGYQNIGLLCANQEQWIFQQHLHGWYKAMLRHHMSPNRVINAALPPAMIKTIIAIAPMDSPTISITCSTVRPLRRPSVKMAMIMAINNATAGLPINSKKTRTAFVFGSVISHTAAMAIRMTGITAAKILFQNDGISSSLNR